MMKIMIICGGNFDTKSKIIAKEMNIGWASVKCQSYLIFVIII